ncbi:hypothetical protein SYNPS1DRAFT_27958 [Syncephalis pseudoplumigaleata]|uniref:Uncharacterized protein n=1 Tax=Syncephalis pseudoplumigaleata TaxID=1712513 RepID=A0A4P9Z3H5_9FUNG|nr:hypothetical protein SYNPS1DRAFT_27958 [Syncephalis pseudoplumigaleata]|eukprot:RKP26351.1 hypothetical protein SYNPS1DRAFT_27958 [Syncephalis pseudoplumigaleata]
MARGMAIDAVPAVALDAGDGAAVASTAALSADWRLGVVLVVVVVAVDGVVGCVADRRLRFTDDRPPVPLSLVADGDGVAVSALFSLPLKAVRLGLSLAPTAAIDEDGDGRLLVASVFCGDGTSCSAPVVAVVAVVGAMAAHGLGIAGSVDVACFVAEMSLDAAAAAAAAFFDCLVRFCFVAFVAALLDTPERLDIAVSLAMVEFAFRPVPLPLALPLAAADGVGVFASVVAIVVAVAVVGAALLVSAAAVAAAAGVVVVATAGVEEDGTGDAGAGMAGGG